MDYEVHRNKEVYIHPSSIVEKGAELDSGVYIGPFCRVSKDSKIGKDSQLISHVVIDGVVEMGEKNMLHPFCVVGGAPQAFKYNQEATAVYIGNGNTIRECVTINRGLVQSLGYTQVGDHNLIMAYTHLAHDVVLGNNCVLANSVQVAGHVQFGNYVTLGGACIVTQFVRIGDHAYVGTGSSIRKDIFPYSIGKDETFRPYGINIVGLKRRGYTSNQIEFLKKVFKIYFYQELSHQAAKEQLRGLLELEPSQNEMLNNIIEFLEKTQLGLAR